MDNELQRETMVSNASDREVLDVCFLLEGTYPYVKGGVSTWVHQIISAMPELKFGILFLGSDERSAGEKKYQIPEQVRFLESCFLFSSPDAPRFDNDAKVRKRVESDPLLEAACDTFRACCESSRKEHRTAVEMTGRLFDIVFELTKRYEFETVWQTPAVWRVLCSSYRDHFEEESFVDFFWNSRFLVEPLWKTLRAVSQLPSAHLYHSVSTGYAGLLGAMAARSTGEPFLLSEHGIYVRERMTDLLRSEWSAGLAPQAKMKVDGVGVLRHLWTEFFIRLGQLSYESAAQIVSLFQQNSDLQVEFGAHPEKLQIIPNGVKLDRFLPIIEARKAKRDAEPERMVVGFLGRVVSIKDVRTLIRAARITCSALPTAKFLIVGPTDEDEAYAAGCRQLITELDLREQVTLIGSKSLEDALPLFDVMALSSVSEGLPFSVLEAFAAEIPVVSTDVGSCAELVLGRQGEMPSLGAAGKIVPPGDAAALGNALTEVLRDRKMQDRFGWVGKARMMASYDERGVIEAYRKLYLGLPRQRLDHVLQNEEQTPTQETL